MMPLVASTIGTALVCGPAGYLIGQRRCNVIPAQFRASMEALSLMRTEHAAIVAGRPKSWGTLARAVQRLRKQLRDAGMEPVA